MASALERAARALAAEDARDRGVDLYDKNPELYLRLARAVLMAVRELPDEILNEHLHDNEYGYAMYYEGWQPAIDAILNEKDTTND